MKKSNPTDSSDQIKQLEIAIESLNLTIKNLTHLFSEQNLSLNHLLDYCEKHKQKIKKQKDELEGNNRKKLFLKKQKEYYNRKEKIISELEALLTIRKKPNAYLKIKEVNSLPFQIGNTILR